jgi:bacillithiol biosynthesis cysteine-adding enzyme BshC
MSSRRHVGERTGVEIWTSNISGSDLVRDYLSGEPGLATFYAGHPFDPDAFRRKADAVHARLSPEARARIAAAMKATRPGAEQKMRRVLNGEGLAVTTGQQAGLFGGPLYTVYKILNAIRLSELLEELLAQPVVPVFWIAADDHDWAEVNHTVVIDTTNELRRIELAASDQPPVPMSHRSLGPDVTGAIDALAAAMPSSEFTESAMGVVRSCYEPGATMASAFGELLRQLFAEFDLILLDPSHPSLKLASVPLLVHDLERTARGNGLLMQQATRLTDAGYHVQVTIAPEAANVFLNDEAGRDRLTRDDGAWTLRRTKRSLSSSELHALISAEPTRFSPNVLLRPVVESALIPTVAYVGGPAEIGYFGQIGCLFHAHGVEPPLVVPRQSVLIVESKVRKVLDKFDLAVDDVMRPFHELATQVIRDELPSQVRDPLARMRAELQAGYAALTEGVSLIDPTLKGFAQSAGNNALSQIDNIEKKVTSHLKKRSEVELEQLRKAAIHLYPEGEPQERVLNALPFLARYGPALLEDIAAVIRPSIDRPQPEWSGVDCRPSD